MDRIFNYNGTPITFSAGDSVMVNATEMAKPFGKRPGKWLELPSTREYISTLRGIRKLDSAEGVITTSGGPGGGGGTWMNEDVALEFARWLSPQFAIWCNDRIKELMQHGVTATPQKLEEMLQDPDTLIIALTELKKERARAEMAEQQVALSKDTIKAQAPKVEYCEEVLTSESTYTSTTIAKELGMGAPTLHQKLREMRIMYKVDGHWVLYHQYQGKGLTKTRTATYTDRKGETHTNITTVWTEKGRAFLHRRLNKELKTA